MTLTGFDIGLAPSQKFTVVFTSDEPFPTTKDQKITIKVRARGDMGTTPYYSFGTYYDDNVKREGHRYTFECVDCMKNLDTKEFDIDGKSMA